ncbi:bifunctional transcriptional activator/DNA repair enzyme AdaA [Brevibacillus sp. B_LB10_24]|uniref:bifunctional transcriptional activator/DNA repair enzyme AdaA n=1 Tax=Brevibacillus sp. B_LB10_24 TaxID=3380645 RepID=UPI0038BB6B98
MNAELFDKVYDSIVKKESTYDGVYYTGVKTTRIVCRPSCRAKTPKRENITLYTSVKAAIRDGFRPCKRCKPETPGALGPDAQLAAQTDAVIDACYGERVTLQAIAQKLAISPYHLQRTYKRVTGLTPMERLHQTRLSAAKRLLENGNLPMFEVAAAVGFRSASHFAVWFRGQTGLSPSAYREGNVGNRQA